MKKQVWIFVLIVVVAAMVAVLVMNKKSNAREAAVAEASEEVLVELYPVVEEEYEIDFSSNGTLLPEKELNFVSDVSGRVVELLVDKGTVVRKGQPLLRIDSELLAADYQSAQATYEALKKDYERFSRSQEAGGVTRQQLDNIHTQLVAAESRMTVSRRRLADAEVKAPMAGMVNQRYVELGSLIAPNVPLFDIVDNSRLRIRCNVSETQVQQLSKGGVVHLTSTSVPGKTYTGVIDFVGVKTDRGLNYPVEVVLTGSTEGLRTGMYVKVRFSTNDRRQGLLIPRRAILGSVKSANVYVVVEGKAQKRDIHIGTMVGDRVEVLDGLQAGDRLIVAGLMNVAPGVKVHTLIKLRKP